MSSRHTCQTLALASRYGLPESAAPRLEALLDELEAEPDPPTTVRERAEARDKHLADSLSGLEIEALRSATRVADLGSGAGFPGLPLAIALPNARIDLIESTRRKCEVIERLGRAARIENAHALPSRVEEWAAAEGAGGYDAVTARALASLPVLVEYASPLLREGGVLVAWKGTRDAEEERAGARAGEQVGMSSQGVHSVTPFAGAKHHHLHVYEKVRATPPGYPRRPGMARKRPLG